MIGKILSFFFREVESRLAIERSAREKIESLLEESREQNRHLATTITAKSHDQHQKQITDLQNELEQVNLFMNAICFILYIN